MVAVASAKEFTIAARVHPHQAINLVDQPFGQYGRTLDFRLIAEVQSRLHALSSHPILIPIFTLAFLVIHRPVPWIICRRYFFFDFAGWDLSFNLTNNPRVTVTERLALKRSIDALELFETNTSNI